MESKKFLLQEKDIPTAWYNIVADMENKPLPPLNPKTKEPLKPEDLYPLTLSKDSVEPGNEPDGCLDRNPGRSSRECINLASDSVGPRLRT